MLANPRQLLAYLSVVTVSLGAVAFGSLGLVRAATSQTDFGLGVCGGLVKAQANLEKASALPNLSPQVTDGLAVLIEGLDVATELEMQGQVEEARVLEQEIDLALKAMASEADQSRQQLVSLLRSAGGALAPCLGHVVPSPTPPPTPTPTPAPTSTPTPAPEPDPTPAPSPNPEGNRRLIYSARFMCGSETFREPSSEGSPDRPDATARTMYETEIGVFNFSPGQVTIWREAVRSEQRAESIGAAPRARPEILAPGESMTMDCGDIGGLLGPATATCSGGAVQMMVDYNMAHDCTAPDAAGDGATDDQHARSASEVAALSSGFLVIETPAELEVTALYRARSFGGDASAGSVVSIDVEQIQPHLIPRPM